MEEQVLAIGDIIVGIDIGTSKVSLVIGEVNNFNQIEVICTASRRCKGIQKGKIINENEIASCINKLIKEAETDANLKINSAYVTVPGKYITIVQNSISKEAKDKYAGISAKDVVSTIMQAKDIDVPEGKQIIDIVENQFVLENGKKVSDPIGNLSGSFTLKAQVILADKDYMRQVASIFRKADLDIDGLVPVTLAERSLALDTNELNDNVMLLDIGAGNTDIGVFEGNNFVYTNTVALGGDNITKDIALVLNISEEEADKLKRQYGLALKSFIDNDNEILLTTYKGDEGKKVIKSSELIAIMEARIEEIFSLVNRDISTQGIKPRINNVILTGQGITSINKSDVAGKIILNIPVKIATGRLISIVRPEYRTAYSLVRYVASRPFAKTVGSSIDSDSEEGFFRTLLERVKEFFYS
ncbi:MAG: cell division protein FtsA [Clostridia bacterium]|nr:cell division protein FtsA [Clostridia bacterium]